MERSVDAPYAIRLKAAAEDGILLAVKWGVLLIVLSAIILFALGDYAQVRQGAMQGAEAFRIIQQARQAQPPSPQP